jgi:hypothetical protein
MTRIELSSIAISFTKTNFNALLLLHHQLYFFMCAHFLDTVMNLPYQTSSMNLGIIYFFLEREVWKVGNRIR